eukprot:scaffold1873_cov394-Pavlova_lutheri.AAC.2
MPEEDCCTTRDTIPYMASTMATDTVAFYFKWSYLVNLPKKGPMNRMKHNLYVDACSLSSRFVSISKQTLEFDIFLKGAHSSYTDFAPFVPFSL